MLGTVCRAVETKGSGRGTPVSIGYLSAPALPEPGRAGIGKPVERGFSFDETGWLWWAMRKRLQNVLRHLRPAFGGSDSPQSGPIIFEPSATVSSQNTTGRPIAAPNQIRALSHHDNPVRHTRRFQCSPDRWHYTKPCHLSGKRGPVSYGKVSGPFFYSTDSA